MDENSALNIKLLGKFGSLKRYQAFYERTIDGAVSVEDFYKTGGSLFAVSFDAGWDKELKDQIKGGRRYFYNIEALDVLEQWVINEIKRGLNVDIRLNHPDSGEYNRYSRRSLVHTTDRIGKWIRLRRMSITTNIKGEIEA